MKTGAHSFQKATGRAVACTALPAGTICPSARRYFRQQVQVMVGLGAVVFCVPTIVSTVYAPIVAALSGF